MRRVAGGEGDAGHQSAVRGIRGRSRGRSGAGVGVLPGRGDPRGGARHGLVPGDSDNIGRALTAVDRRVVGDLVVGDCRRQRRIAGVGDLVGPGHRGADRHERTGRCIGVESVGELLERQATGQAPIVRRVIVSEGAQSSDRLVGVVGRLGADHRDVGVLPLEGHPRARKDPHLGEVEGSVVVGVTRDITGRLGQGPVVGGVSRRAGIIGDAHPHHRSVAGVAHLIAPGHRPADGHIRPGRGVGVLTVGELLEDH